MKPIRVKIVFTDDEGTWVDTTSEGLLVIVLDNGQIKTLLEDSVRVKSPNDIRIRAIV